MCDLIASALGCAAPASPAAVWVHSTHANNHQNSVQSALGIEWRDIALCGWLKHLSWQFVSSFMGPAGAQAPKSSGMCQPCRSGPGYYLLAPFIFAACMEESSLKSIHEALSQGQQYSIAVPIWDWQCSNKLAAHASSLGIVIPANTLIEMPMGTILKAILPSILRSCFLMGSSGASYE